MVVEKNKKGIFNIIRAIVAVAFLIIFFSFPFLHNHINFIAAQVLWYLSLLVIFILGLTIEKSKRKKTLWTYIGDSGLLPIVVIFLSVFIINYYNTKYDVSWAIFTFIATGIPAVSFAIVTFFKEEQNVVKEQLNKMRINVLKVTLLWWLLDLFFISSVKDWEIWPYIFGVIALIIIFYNLTVSFLSNKTQYKVLLLHDFVLGIGLTIYLLYKIPNEKLQTIMIAVISAVYGGLITLVGVAWTIKEAHNASRNAHLSSIKPLFYAIKYSNINYRDKSNILMKFIEKDKPEIRGYILGLIRNSDKTEFIIENISIDGTQFSPDNYTPTVIQKDKVVELTIHIESEVNENSEVYLFVKDIEDNKLKYQIILDNEKNEILRIVEVRKNG